MNIFEFAQEKEKQAENVYRELAEKSLDKGMKYIFTLLANAEKRHYDAIQRMKQDERFELSECAILGDVKTTLAKMGPGKEAFKTGVSQVEIYKEAQKNEETSEKFYREKAGEVQNAEHRKIFSILANEEHEHYIILETIIGLVDSPESRLENAEFNKKGNF